MSILINAVIPAQAGIQTNIGSPTIGGPGPSLRWGDDREMAQ
jgi:hypothetical protein